MTSRAKTVTEYLKSLPDDRRAALQAVRKVILKNLPKGIEEGMQYGGIGYFIPHKLYPPGYHCKPSEPLPVAGLASQKNHMAFYSCAIYWDPKLVDWFVKQCEATGKRLDMGKACVRFKKLENLPLDVVGKLVAKMKVKDIIAAYERNVKK